jgi:hypothetical protein
MGDTLVAMLRGDEPGSGRKIAAYAGALAVGTALWWTFSLTMTGLEAAGVTVVVLGGALAVLTGVKLRQSRRGRSRGRSITVSPRARWAHWSSRYRRVVPSKRNLRVWGPTKVPMAARDRWFGTYEVTRTRKVNGKTVATTKRVRGLRLAQWHDANPGAGWTSKGWDLT